MHLLTSLEHQRIDNVPVLSSWGIAVLVTKLADIEHVLNKFLYAYPGEWSWANHALGRPLSFLPGSKAVMQGINQEATACENGEGL